MKPRIFQTVIASTACLFLIACGQSEEGGLRDSIEKSMKDASDSIKQDLAEVGEKVKEKADAKAEELKAAATEKMDEVKQKASLKAEEFKAEAEVKLKAMAEDAKASLKAKAEEMSDQLVQSMKETKDELLKSLSEKVQAEIADLSASFTGNEPAMKDGKVESVVEAVGSGNDAKALEEMHKVSEQDLTAAQQKKVDEFKSSVTAFIVQRNFSSVEGGKTEVNRAVQAISEGRTEAGIAELEKLQTKVTLTSEQKELIVRLRQ